MMSIISSLKFITNNNKQITNINQLISNVYKRKQKDTKVSKKISQTLQINLKTSTKKLQIEIKHLNVLKQGRIITKRQQCVKKIAKGNANKKYPFFKKDTFLVKIQRYKDTKR